MKLKVVGQDPSLRNWGICVSTYDTETKKLTVQEVSTVCPVINTHKQVRQNSMDLASAVDLFEAAQTAMQHADAVFVEIPVGSQSARAMASYGICVGVLGSLVSANNNLFEVTPTEVKMATCGSKTATKQEMIEWAMTAHPEAPWPTFKRNGTNVVSASKAEHMADALGAIYAGLSLPTFKQALNLIKPNYHANPVQTK